MPKLSVVFPTKNEEPTIARAIGKVRETFPGEDLEIVVSDSSSDRTPEIAAGMGAKVVSPPRLGYGAAYIHGFKQCTGEIVAMADPDGTYDLGELSTLLKPLLDGTADFVMGSRLKGDMEKGAMPASKRYFGNPLLTWILNVLFRTGISDAHCGMRALGRVALESMDLKTTGMEFASEMLVEAKRKGLRIAEVPISYHPREGTPSKLSSLGDGWRHISYMVRARLGFC
jgi:glycosyltransferase involved in cell wall biosynthesis